jgi:hypothetical protein
MKTTMRVSRGITAVLGLFLGSLLLLSTAHADQISLNPSNYFSPNSAPFNHKFSEWSAEWWQFVLSFPGDVNPNLDATGAKCVIGQHGPVWFLMGSFGGPITRTCTIPDGKALFFPILNFVDLNVTTQTADELRAEIAPCMDAVTALSVEVDGLPIENFNRLQEKFRVRSVVFEVSLPDNNLFGLVPGTYSPAVDDGFYMMLKPLGVGTHTLHVSGATDGCPIAGGTPFAVDVTYNLNIVPVELK